MGIVEAIQSVESSIADLLAPGNTDVLTPLTDEAQPVYPDDLAPGDWFVAVDDSDIFPVRAFYEVVEPMDAHDYLCVYIDRPDALDTAGPTWVWVGHLNILEVI